MFHILVAEDDEDDQFMFSEVIDQVKGENIKVTFANDGAQLLKYLDKHPAPPPPDAIFLDINLPFKTGLECLSAIRQKKKYAQIPVFMLSTSINPKDIDYSFENGANLYIDKSLFYSMKATQLKNLLFKISKGDKPDRQSFFHF